MTESLAQLNPPGEHLPELVASLVGGGAESVGTLAFRVLGPPSDENAVVVADLLRQCPCQRSVQSALERKLSRGLCHARTLTLPPAVESADKSNVNG